MTIPSIPVFDDWKFDLLNLTTGATFACNLNRDLIDIKGVSIPGVTADRLESVDMTLRARESDGTPTPSAEVLFANKLLMFRAVPYGLSAKAVYGLVIKPDAGYNQQGRFDAIEVHAVGIEYLLHSRVVYNVVTGAAAAITATAAADDYAKRLVRYCALAGTCANDLDGNSRNWGWGTLAVQADAGLCASVTLSSREDWLDSVIVAISDKYGFDWELRPTISGGAVTFTFSTRLRNTIDRSIGNAGSLRPVIIADRGGLIPSAKRWWSLAGVITALHTANLAHVELNAGTLAEIGRWEGRAQGNTVADLEIGLNACDIEEGYEGEFDATTLAGSVSWLEDFDTGDKVTRLNNRLDVAADNDRIGAVIWSFPQKRLKLEIRWGDAEPGLLSKTTGGAYRRPLQIPPDDYSDDLWSTSGGYLYPSASPTAIRMFDGADLEMYSTADTTTLKFSVDGATGYILSASSAELAGGSLFLVDTNTWVSRGASQMNFRTDKTLLSFQPAGAAHFTMSATALAPQTTNTEELGSSTKRFANAYAVLGNFSGQITSGLSTGTSPFAVTSTTVCSNLNADLLDGFNASQSATNNYIVVRDGANIAMAAGGTVDGVDISAHVHTYSKTTAFSTSDYTVGAIRGAYGIYATEAEALADSGTYIGYGTTRTHTHSAASISYTITNTATPS
jgi:hypothetical protein